MKSESNIRPTEQYNIETVGEDASIKFYDNIVEKPSEGEDDVVRYEWDEYTVTVTNRENLDAIISANLAVWLSWAKSQEHNSIYNQEISELKQKLNDSDYKAIKFAEGLISADEYETIKSQRLQWRARINELENLIEI